MDQGARDSQLLAMAEARDHRTDERQHWAGGGQWHQNWCDAWQGGRDEARRGQEFKGADGLEGAGAEVVDPLGGGAHAGRLLLGHERLGTAGQSHSGQP
jgi:hypothetical protein